ncbi:MAG: hypothetical protein ACE14L_13960 [Terriglobales bacterium]
MAEPLRGRALIEARFGPLGKGQRELIINDAEYDFSALLARMDLAVDDIRVIDAVPVAANHYCLRYYDGQDQRIVAHEFDSNFAFLNETRAHVAEWIGEDAYYESIQNPFVPCAPPIKTEE